MEEESLIELIEETVDREEIELPIFNPVALKLQQQLTKGDYNLPEIAKIIERDQGLASDVLRMANSVFYAGVKPVKSIHYATVRLGAKTIFNMVSALTQKQLYRSRKREYDYWAAPLWSHALGVAYAARWLSRHLGMDRLADEAFMAGLLHDIGKLLLLKVIEDLDGSRLPKKGISRDLVDDILETMHTDHGKRLMRRMNMPDVYCEVVEMHHNVEVDAENSILNVVRLGNLACHKARVGLKHDPNLLLETTSEAISLNAIHADLDGLQRKLEEYNEWMGKFLT